MDAESIGALQRTMSQLRGTRAAHEMTDFAALLNRLREADVRFVLVDGFTVA